MTGAQALVRQIKDRGVPFISMLCGNGTEPVIDAAVEAGANAIYGVSFGIDKPEDLASEAREKAIADALAKAEELAELNGVQVGEVVSISEIVGQTPYYGVERAALMADGLGGAGPFTPGEQEVSLHEQGERPGAPPARYAPFPPALSPRMDEGAVVLAPRGRGYRRGGLCACHAPHPNPRRSTCSRLCPCRHLPKPGNSVYARW